MQMSTPSKPPSTYSNVFKVNCFIKLPKSVHIATIDFHKLSLSCFWNTSLNTEKQLEVTSVGK